MGCGTSGLSDSLIDKSLNPEQKLKMVQNYASSSTQRIEVLEK